MKIEYDSHSLFFKNPFGAVCCGERVFIKIFVCKSEWPKKVVLRYNIGGNEFSKRLHYYCSMADMNVFEAFIDMPGEPCVLFYWFEVLFEDEALFYGNNCERLGGVGKIYKSEPEKYQITVYDKSYKTPQWLKEGIMYQIFPDRFYKTDSYDGLEKVFHKIIKRNWGEEPFHKAEQFGGSYLANDCFGGSLAGIREKLGYLSELGINIIYLNPIFEASSNHKYNTANYEKIDALFGDEEEFKRLCDEAENHKIKIILDGVFSHTGSDSIYFNKNGSYSSVGAYQSRESKYYKWYKFEKFPDKYECWWGIDSLPEVEENEESYVKYILTGENSIIKKWVKLGASGWRLDVADELPDEFIKTLRYELKKVKSDAAIIGEVWEDASNKTAYGKLREYLGGLELDSVMNYPAREAIISFCKGEIDAKGFNLRLLSLKENYPKEAFFAAMNFLSSHDTERILTKISPNFDKEKNLCQKKAGKGLSREEYIFALDWLFIAVVLQFSLPGVPCIFYGDEAGLEGASDPFCRKCFPWGEEKGEVFEIYKKAIQIRKLSEAFAKGELEFVYGEGQTSGFLRRYKNEVYVVLVNSSDEHDRYVSMELGRFSIFRIENAFDKEEHECDYGRFCVHIGKLSWKIYRGEIKDD